MIRICVLLYSTKLSFGVQELHEQELGAHRAQQGGLQEAQAEVERLTAKLASQQRQTQQV